MNIELNKNGININGEYRVLICSSLFYFRIPRERWETRIIQLKNAGYTGVDVYFPWNYHEIQDGVWDFEGQKDADYFLSLCAQHNLFVIARPGPYICSEWDGGGIPARLYTEDIKLRQHDEKYYGELQKWFAQIIPVIVKYQITNGGSVILFQVENELDFFECLDRKQYMETLTEKCVKMGINVPVIACAGQWDMERATGNAEGVNPAFNVYSDWNSPQLQEKCMITYQQMYDADHPFILMETERGHNYLKRELCAGAKLMCSYNQVAGMNMEYCNGISNWGWGENEIPISYMTSDYDFNSMIACSGEVTQEYLQARLLANLLRTFGSRLAKGTSCAAEGIEVESEFQDDTLKTCMLEFEGGKFYSVSNLSNFSGSGKIKRKGKTYEITAASGKTLLLPESIELSYFGADIRLDFATAEINYIVNKDNEIQVCLYSEGVSIAEFYLASAYEMICQGEHRHVEGLVKISSEMEEVLFIGKEVKVRISFASEKASAVQASPFLPELPFDFDKQKEACIITEAEGKEYHLDVNDFTEQKVDFMEKHGGYRGKGFYRYQAPGSKKLMLNEVGDILTIYKDGEMIESVFSYGDNIIMDAEKGEYIFQTEIWGHSNFDDPRYYATRIGSMRGIGKISEICAETDITQLWRVCRLDQGGSDFIFYSDINSYTVTGTPVQLRYEKEVALKTDCDTFILHFPKSDVKCEVYVDGELAGVSEKFKEYVDISRCISERREVKLQVVVYKRYYSDRIGNVTLYQGRKVQTCGFARRGLESLKNLNVCGTEAMKLPLALQRNKMMLLKIDLSEFKEHDIRIEFIGKGLKLDAVSQGTDIGRMILPCEHAPSIKGGSANTVMMCAEWLHDPLYVLVQSLENGILEKIVINKILV